MISERIIRQVFECLRIIPNEKIILIYDHSSEFLFKSLFDQLKKYDVTVFNLDSYNRPLKEVPKDILKSIKGKDLCFYFIDKKCDKHGDEVVFRKSLNKILEEEDVRIGNMLSINQQVIKSAFGCDVKKIKKFTEILFDYMKSVSKVKVTSAEGTDVIFEFDKSYKWCMSTGFIEKLKARNVMPAEIYTYPANVNGKIVITGTYSYLTNLLEFSKYKNSLEKTPITWNIKNGKILKVFCDNKKIENKVKKQVFEIENGNRIGEYGMGTNTGIKNCLGIMMHDEKYPGVHVAHGHGYSERTGAKYFSDIHFDGVILRPTIINLDTNKLIMKTGKYKI
ncbi:hypothetical protein COV11_01875 [Candidatus Woesearchaeota archaeon CG10_big_fil_rev_8_21_14_0_10_30_7]|nr:MAG: hypothetical protein COV11_01875 [Candidatus Woesearchaeota archaeon CG10_big_fil_rev_8_21_14_0_10_30_7]